MKRENQRACLYSLLFIAVSVFAYVILTRNGL
jgi:inner membrane protein involved in colicin E2 resistance